MYSVEHIPRTRRPEVYLRLLEQERVADELSVVPNSVEYITSVPSKSRVRRHHGCVFHIENGTKTKIGDSERMLPRAFPSWSQHDETSHAPAAISNRMRQKKKVRKKSVKFYTTNTSKNENLHVPTSSLECHGLVR